MMNMVSVWNNDGKIWTLFVIFSTFVLQTGFLKTSISAEKLLDKTVYLNDNAVGKIDRVIINRKTGDISSVVLAAPIGLMDLSFKYYIIPIDRISEQSDRLVLSINLSQFKKAPYIPEQKYDKSELLERDWIEKSLHYYDVIDYEFGFYD